jgi:hypothetical protein
MNKQTVWTNRATRNIHFYIDENEEARSIKADLIKLIHRPINEQDIRRFVRDYLLGIHRTLLASSGEDDCNIADINWQEIANVWEAERHRLKKM